MIQRTTLLRALLVPVGVCASLFTASARAAEPTGVGAWARHVTSGDGRVVATITTLDGTVHIASVDVELRAVDGNVVLAKTVTDGQGQVTFPDVPAGRYMIRASRPGFVPTDSTPFDVRGGQVAQVLLDIDLTFVAESLEVRAPISPTQSIQPVSTSDMMSSSVLEIAPIEGDDFQSLLTLLPGVVRGPEGRLRAKGGQPTLGALHISCACLVYPSTGDFDLELRGSSLESVEMLANRRSRVPILDERHADRHETGNQRVAGRTRQPRAPLPERVQRRATIRASLLGPRAAPEGSTVPGAGPSVPLRQRPGQKSAGRAGNRAHELRFVHPNRQRALGSTYARRSRRHVPAQYRAFDDEHVPPA
jgi:hypothetical protein